MGALEKYKAYEHKTFGDAAALYLAAFDGKDKRRQAICVESLDPYIGHLKLVDVDNDALEIFKEDRKLGVGAFDKPAMVGTINKELTIVTTILNRACKDWRWIPSVPIILKLNGPARKAYPLTWEQQAKLFYRLNDYLQQLCLFVLNTGLRREELFSLRWEDEKCIRGIEFFAVREFDENRVRPVILNSVSRQIIFDMSGKNSDFVFRRTNVSKPIRKAWVRAGLPGHPLVCKGIQNFRYTFSNRLHQAGASEFEHDTLMGLRYHKREQSYYAADLRRLSELSEKVTLVLDPELPVYY